MSFGRRAALNFATQIAGFGVTLVDRLVLVAILIRSWGPGIYSDWATLMATVGMFAVAEFGFQTYLGNMLTRADARSRSRAFQRVVDLGLFFYLVLAASLILATIAILILGDLHQLLNLRAIEAPGAPFLILALYQILRVARGGVAQILRGKGEVHRLMAAEVRSLGGAVILSSAVVLAGAGPTLVACVYLGCELALGTGWAMAEVRRRHRGVRFSVRRPTVREVRAAGSNLRWYGWLALTNNAMNHLPVLVLAWLGFGGPLLISFVVQRTLVNVTKTCGAALSIALGVEVARARDEGHISDYQDGMSFLARINAAMAALTAAGLLCFGGAVIAFWTGQTGLASHAILLWLLLPLVLTASAIPLQMLSTFGNLPKPQAVSSAAQMLIGLPLAVLAGIRFGVSGVAFGVGLGEILAVGILLPWLSARPLGIAYPKLLGETLLILLGAGLWSGAIGLALAYGLPAANFPQLVGVLALWAALSGGPVLMLSLPPRMRARPANRLASLWSELRAARSAKAD